MAEMNFVLLYVNSPTASAAFYADLLGKTPVEASPTFAMFAMESGIMLGLWSRQGVAPAAVGGPGSSEIAFCVPDADTVSATHAEWRGRGVAIAQEPTAMDFGYTFVALDPDGHRLRVFTPSGR